MNSLDPAAAGVVLDWCMSSMMRRLVVILALAVVASVAAAKEPFPFKRQDGSIERDRAIGRPAGSLLAELGQELFFDVRLSRTGRTACATCHNPEYFFAQPSRVSRADDGRLGERNAPSLLNAGLFPALMWDGRFHSLEQQALSPFQRGEMGIDVDEAVRRLNFDFHYVELFRAALRDRPTASGMAKALAAYQQTLISGVSRFDRFLLHNETAMLTPLEEDGFQIFDGKARCSTCHDIQPRNHRPGHWLPLLTDFRFHNLGVGFKFGQFADAGRFRVTGSQEDAGAFRTPSLRNVALTAPYMHDGSFATLEEVVEFYDAGGRRNPNLSPVIRPLFLNDYEKAALVSFLRSLNDQRLPAEAEAVLPSATRRTASAGNQTTNVLPPPAPVNVPSVATSSKNSLPDRGVRVSEQTTSDAPELHGRQFAKGPFSFASNLPAKRFVPKYVGEDPVRRLRQAFLLQSGPSEITGPAKTARFSRHNRRTRQAHH